MAAAILLAGGLSTRMGREKPLLLAAGETLLARHARQLRSIGVDPLTVIVNHENHRALARSGLDARFLPQRFPGMTGAVRTALLEVPGPDLFLVCVNDVVHDSAYQALARSKAPHSIPCARLDRVFQGGMLHLDPDNRVRAIVEKPPGGCPPGAFANIMIHRTRCAGRLLPLLESGLEYEPALNVLIDSGLEVHAIPLDFWIAVKHPADYDRLNKTLDAAPGNVP